MPAGEILLVEIFLATLLDNQALGILAYQHASHIEGLGRLHRLRAGKLCDTCIGLVNLLPLHLETSLNELVNGC